MLKRERDLNRNLMLSPFGDMNDRFDRGHSKHSFRKWNKFGEVFSEPGFMKEKLSMNEEQIEKITDLNKKFDSEFSSYINLIKPEREKLKRMLKNDGDVDFDAVKQQLKRLSDIGIETNLLRIKQGNEISKILSPEQMKKLRAERKIFFDNMQKDRRQDHGKENGKEK